MKISDLYSKYLECGARVTTDSRTVKGGEMFFALRGENMDGNDYALAALDAGVGYAVVSRDSAVAHRVPGSVDDARTRTDDGTDRLIPVDDTLRTLQDLARWHRSSTFVDGHPLKVIALTGTNGKTTTKELIRAVLSVKYVVTATEGNLNNNIGVPLTLLKINSRTQIAVVEMGASHPGDINELTSIALPNYGLITNVGMAHLQGFGSFEGVKQAKGELYDYLQRTADKVFVNVDNRDICSMASQRPDLVKIAYGLNYCGAEILSSTPENPFLSIKLSSGRIVRTNLVGSYNADNVMAALAVGEHFGVDGEAAVRAVENYMPSNNRSQLLKTDSNTVVVDAYNANPTSMEAALKSLETVVAGHKAVMLGNMLELGEQSVAEHVRVVERINSFAGVDLAVLVGGEFRKALDTCPGAEYVKWFATSDEAASYLKTHPVRNHWILVKGSRGSRMETVIPEL